VVVLGGGYIALEFASLLRRLGSHVDLVFRADRILRGFDDDVREHLQEQLASSGVVLYPRRTVTGISRHAGSLRVTLDDGTALDADRVLGATGRRPNTQGLGLESLGVQLSDRGAVVVDDFARSSVEHIHAVGDATDKVMLTPAAIREGHALADCLFGASCIPVRHDPVSTAVFTTPEVGVVGLTEAQAIEQYRSVDVFTTRFRPMTAALAASPRRTLMKLLVHRDDDRLLGAHMVGEDAAEMIQLLGVMVRMGARKRDLDATLPVHPCAAEEWLTLRTPVRRHGVAAAA
jgi:glutathione reductase (NADPH)